MGLIRKYMEEGGGNFATVKNTETNDEITIESVYLDDKTFDKAYININGRRANGEEIKVRLGRQNLGRISEVLGEDETTWPGNRIRCIGTQDYPGLSAKGLLWTGVKVAQQSQLPPQQGSSALPPQAPSVDAQMRAWIAENQGLIGQAIPSTVYNVMPREIIDELVKNKLAYSKNDMPHLDDRAKEFL